MPLGYKFMDFKPMKSKFEKEQELPDRTILQRTSYFLGIKRASGVGDVVGVCLGYYTVVERPIKECGSKGYNYNRMYRHEDFEYFFQGNEFEIWKKELSEYLPGFFKRCNEDITQKIRDSKIKKITDKESYTQSVDCVESIVNCLRSKL